MRRKWKRRPARGAGAARSVSRYPRVDPTTVARAGAYSSASLDFAAVKATALACLVTGGAGSARTSGPVEAAFPASSL